MYHSALIAATPTWAFAAKRTVFLMRLKDGHMATDSAVILCVKDRERRVERSKFDVTTCYKTDLAKRHIYCCMRTFATPKVDKICR